MVEEIPSDRRTTVQYSVFEYDVYTSAASSEDEASTADTSTERNFTVTGTARGVGGVIGVITAGTDTFDYTNNFFVTGDVTAVDSEYVGGVVGFVRASNVELRNILLDHSIVKGQKYVGGIVGGISGTGVKITNSYNLHGTALGSAGAQYQGGIVGGFMSETPGTTDLQIAEGTDASTSYWILDKALDGSGKRIHSKRRGRKYLGCGDRR